MLGRVAFLMLTCLVLAACGGSSATPTPSPTTSPSAATGAPPSPSGLESAGASGTVVDMHFCGTIADLDSAMADYQSIKVKPANGQKLEDQAAAVSRTMDAITTAANESYTSLVGSLSAAVSELVSASEDYATASGARDTQQKRLKKAVTGVTTATTDLRNGSGCTT